MAYIYLLLMVILTTAGQLLIKRGAAEVVLKGSVFQKINSVCNRNIILASGLVIIAPVFYIMALRELDLSIAFAFTGINYILVSLGGKLFFGETLTKFHYLGMSCIFVGVIIFGL